jgi:hypothetical protein
MDFLGPSLPKLLEKHVSLLYTVLLLKRTDSYFHFRLTDDEMKVEFDGGIAKGVLPEAFHHIHVLDTPRMLRYRPNVEKFRISLNNSTDDETRQACIAHTQEQTTTMDHVSDRTLIYLALTLTFDTLIIRRMQLYARSGTRALNGLDFCSLRRSDTERRTRTLLLADREMSARGTTHA